MYPMFTIDLTAYHLEGYAVSHKNGYKTHFLIYNNLIISKLKKQTPI